MYCGLGWKTSTACYFARSLICLAIHAGCSAAEPPLIVDDPLPQVAARVRNSKGAIICHGVVQKDGGFVTENETKMTMLRLFGPSVKTIRVHYRSDDWGNFEAVRTRLTDILHSRPRHLFRGPAWAEPSYLTHFGIIASIEHDSGARSLLEISHASHVCFQDARATHWWTRLVPTDLWDGP